MNKPVDEYSKRLKERIEKQKINTDINDRWEKGEVHHANSYLIFEGIEAIDWMYGDDYFCWKSGGDGDNGETLMYLLDILFDLYDKEKSIK